MRSGPKEKANAMIRERANIIAVSGEQYFTVSYLAIYYANLGLLGHVQLVGMLFNVCNATLTWQGAGG